MEAERKLREFWEKRGARVVRVWQPWRNVMAEMILSNRRVIFKWAGSDEVSRNIFNEADWYKKIGQRLKGVEEFGVPEIIEVGQLEGKNYFVAEYIEGRELASKYPVEERDLSDELDRVAELNMWIMGIEGVETDFDVKDEAEAWKKTRLKVEGWRDKIDTDLKEIWKEFLRLQKVSRRGVTHGDFVPWHLFDDKGKLVMIDAERGRGRGIRLYDVAYFYQRVFTVLKEGLARQYLKEVKMRWRFKENFEEELRPVLASRIIGGYWDNMNGDGTKREKHDRLREVFLENNLI